MLYEDKKEIYKKLADDNGWEFNLDENERPYFMQDGRYAIPNETTSENDKKLLANIISEGSKELENLILNCWSNDLIIAGPCSGIKEFHKNRPTNLHFGVSGSNEIIYPLSEELNKIFPDFIHLYRKLEYGLFRYDLDYLLENKELSKEESDAIFETINKKLTEIIRMNNHNDIMEPHM